MVVVDAVVVEVVDVVVAVVLLVDATSTLFSSSTTSSSTTSSGGTTRGLRSGMSPVSATSLLGLVSNIAPVIVGGNSCVALASETLPLCAVSFAEVLHASDVPAGVVNILTGHREELSDQFASHMDVNAIIYCDADAESARDIEVSASDNIKRVVARTETDWSKDQAQNPYLIRDTQEVKTTWHPIGT